MPIETLIPLLAMLAVFTRELLWVVAGGLLLSNLDDLAMDGCWLWLVALRPKPAPPQPPAKPLHHAILVPAWDESAVIGPMLQTLLSGQRHPRFAVFVGIYPNDPATLKAVRAVPDARIVPVMVAHAGPTTKADCLNQLWRGLLRHEAATGQRFDSIVLHDSEDLVHPCELALFDRWLATLAMVQVPVLPIADAQSRWISGHYIDEFAQGHIRDLMVRGALGAPVPSAGVGTAIRRDAIEALARDGVPFDPTSLTEDYEIGLRLHALGFAGRLVRQQLHGSLVAVREYFPASLSASVRQKARWLTGIALDGWDRLGWDGPLAHRWMLLRDRKGLFTAALGVLAYALSALVLGQLLLRWAIGHWHGIPLPPLFPEEQNRLLLLLLAANAVLLAWRLAWRAGFTAAAHGWREGLRAIPRAITTNIVNALAALRAVERYRQALESRQPPAWDKTDHRFPQPHEAGAHGR